MKRFLFNLTLFFIILGSLVFGITKLSDFLINQRKKQILTINKDITKLFSGDSNVECAINDSLIANSLNIAQSGEAYLYTYVKLKSILDYNPQIRTIFVGISYADLLKDTEERWLFNQGFVIEKIGAYNYLMNYPEKSVIIKNEPKAYFRGLMKSVFSNLKTFSKSFSVSGGKIENFGGYEYLNRDKLQVELMNAKAVEDKPHPEGLIQTEYLYKISKLCQQKSVNLVLLNTPKHNSYFLDVQADVKKTWLAVRHTLVKDSLMDFSAMSFPDSCYGDITHLNHRGAKLFSQFLNKRLNSE
jgi:hypothetical protein